MTDGDILVNDQRRPSGHEAAVVRDMQNAPVLNVGPCADLDAMDVPADHASGPDGRTRAERHLADHDRGLVDPSGRIDHRMLLFERTDVRHGYRLWIRLGTT